MPPIVNQCHSDDIASYKPEYLGGQLSSAEMTSPVESGPSLNAAPSTEPQLPFVLGFLASPRFQTSALKNIESFVQVGKQLARPAVSVVETVGTASAVLWSGVGALFGAELGVSLLGPAPALEAAMIPQGMDFTSDKLQRLGLKPEEIFVLTSRLTEHPERRRLIHQALSKPSVQEQRQALRAAASDILPPGQTVQIKDAQGDVIAQYTHDPQRGIRSAPADVVQAENNQQGTCPSDMVFVPKGVYKGKEYPDLCVDEHEYTDSDNRLPKVRVSWTEATALCAARGRRLPTSMEWARVASENGAKKYSTRSGGVEDATPSGVKAVHYNAPTLRSRAVCMALGAYIAYQGREICDLSGNVSEWTSDQHIIGGSWVKSSVADVLAIRRYRSDDVGSSFTGFRCVASPQVSAK